MTKRFYNFIIEGKIIDVYAESFEEAKAEALRTIQELKNIK